MAEELASTGEQFASPLDEAILAHLKAKAASRLVDQDELLARYPQVADELRSQYSIGYYPVNKEHDGRWRAIRVETHAAGATVRARSGYWAK